MIVAAAAAQKKYRSIGTECISHLFVNFFPRQMTNILNRYLKRACSVRTTRAHIVAARQ